MNKPPSRRKTTKSVAIRRPPNSEPESVRPRDSGRPRDSVRARDAAETAPPPRAGKATVPDMPRARRNSKGEMKAQEGTETTRPRRPSRADGKAAEPPPRRDTKAGTKRATVPPRTKRDSKAPKEDADLEANAVSIKVRVDAPFRISGELPDPEGSRYSVIPSPRTKKKPAS